EWKEITDDADRSVTSLRVPSLVKVGDDVFAVAEAHCKKKQQGATDGGFTGIASWLLRPGEGAAMEPAAAGTSSFRTQLLKKGEEEAEDIMRPTTVVHGNDVYMLLGNYGRATPTNEASGKAGWKLFLVKGTVTGEVDGAGKKIEWGKPHSVEPETVRRVQSLTRLVGGGGSGVVLEDGTLAFPMQATDKDGKRVLLAMRFTPSENKWELSDDTTGAGCRDPSIVEWGDDGNLLAMAHCAGGYYDVYMSTGRQWYPTGESISRVWGNSLRRQGGHGVQSGFTTAEFGDKKVMLLTTPVYSAEGDAAKARLHLWATDMQRVYDVGPVSDAAHNAAASSLLYRSGAQEEELIALYEKSEAGESYSLVSVPLTAKLQEIKEVVKKWTALDTALKECTSTGSDAVPALKGVCKSSVPTEGLVGLLSNTLEKTAWKDEYRCVDATVTAGAVASTAGIASGVTFKGAGAGAEWPVGKLGQNQPYYFANNEFALVATVIIHAVPEEDTPLLGARMNDTESTVLFGLSYTAERKWKAKLHGAAAQESSGAWEPNKTYQVVLEMRGDEWFVHVD
ncbi:trans-sialidase, partial [Trypanosoma conorhini]